VAGGAPSGDQPRDRQQRGGEEEELRTAQARLLDLLARDAVEETPQTPPEYRYLDEKLKLQEIELKREHARQDIELRRTYAKWLLIILAAELVVVNAVFGFYAAVGEEWNVPEGVIQAWLGATFVQVVGVVAVVTKYLFPRRDRTPDLAVGVTNRTIDK
jgi:hypothetical protein